MRVERIDPIADLRWAAFVDQAATAQVFHHPAWLRHIAEAYRFAFAAPCVVDDAGAIVGGLPIARVGGRLGRRRLVAVPFSDRCPPLFADGAQGYAAEPLGQALQEERRRHGLDLEVRGPLPGVDGAFTQAPFLHHRLALSADLEAVRRNTRPQIRRGVARATRAGVQVQEATDRAALDAFYALHVRTRRRQGVPVQPRRFILGLEALFAQGLGFVLVARHDGRAVAAAVFLSLHRTLYYKYGASDERHLGLRPNNLLFMEAIRLGCTRGFERLDFGRTDLDNPGLAAFKRAWGAEERSLTYAQLSARAPREGRGLARRALKVVIQRSPPVAGRMIGTLLYRYAA